MDRGPWTLACLTKEGRDPVRSKHDQKVAVAYPHPGHVHAKFHQSLLNMFIVDACGGTLPDGRKVGGHRRIVAGGAHIPISSGAVIARARNRLVVEFLKLDGIDWLLMIDTDMTFAPDLIEMLVSAAHPTERPVVGGLCFQFAQDKPRKFWPTLYAWLPETTRLRRLTQYLDNTLVPVAATGAACLLIHRTVLEAMRAKYPPPRPWFDETPFYEHDADGKPILESGDEYSEDITFSLRVQACGFPVFVHTGIKLGHVKEFEADEAAFIAESTGLAEPVVPALPTFVVIASKDRPEMLSALRARLAGQATDVFVMDNGYDVAPDGSIEAHGWPLHRMWNEGLTRAEEAAAGRPFNVAVLNDDVDVPADFLARLESGLRARDDIWVACPNHQDLDIPDGQAMPVVADGQAMSGWAFMLRGEAGLRFDERFVWWYGDADLERQVRQAGKHVVCVGGCHAHHLDPLRSTLDDPVRLAQAEVDERRFAEKWGVDPASLWLAQRKVAV